MQPLVEVIIFIYLCRQYTDLTERTLALLSFSATEAIIPSPTSDQ